MMAVRKQLLEQIPVIDEEPIVEKEAAKRKALVDQIPVIEDQPAPQQKPVDPKKPVPLTSIVHGTDPDEDALNIDFISNVLPAYVGSNTQPRTVTVPTKDGANMYGADEKGITVGNVAKSGNTVKTSTYRAEKTGEQKVTENVTNMPSGATMDAAFPNRVAAPQSGLSPLALAQAQETAKKEVEASSNYLGNFFNQYKKQFGSMLYLDPEHPMQTVEQNMSSKGMFSKENFLNRILNKDGDTRALSQYRNMAVNLLSGERTKELNALEAAFPAITQTDDLNGNFRESTFREPAAQAKYDAERKRIEQKYLDTQRNLMQAVNAMASLKTVNKKINELGASRLSELDPTEIGMEVARQTGYAEKVKSDQAKIQKGEKLSPEDRVAYMQQGYQALQYSMMDQFSKDRQPVVKEISEKVKNYPKKILDDNPEYVKAQKIKALSAQIFKDENAVLSSVIDNDPTQEDIAGAAQKLGLTKEDIAGITPGDIQNPKVWYNRALGSFVNNSAGGLYKLGMRGVAAAYEGAGGDVDWDAFNKHYDHDWYDNMGGPFGGKSLMGASPTGASLFGEGSTVNTDHSSGNFLRDEANPNAGKFNWDVRAVLNQIGEGAGQIAAFGYGGSKIGQAYQGIALARKGQAAAVLLNDAGQAAALANRGMRFGTTVSTFLTQYADNYTDALGAIGNNPDDEGKRNLYAIMKTTSSALTEQILPDAKIMDNILGSGTGAGRELVNMIRTQGVKGLERGTVRQLVTRGLKEGIVDWQKEISEDVLDNLGGMITDAVLAPKQFESTDYLEQQKQTYITSAISSAIPTLSGGMRHVHNNSKMQKALMFEVGSNPQVYADDITKRMEAGEMDRTEANQRIQVVNTLSNIVENHVPEISPANGKLLTPSQKMDYTHSMMTEALLKKSIRDDTDPVQKKHIETQINELQKQRDELLTNAGNRRDPVIVPPVTEQNTPAAEETQEQTDPSNPYGFKEETENGESEESAQQTESAPGSNEQSIPAPGSEQQPAPQAATELQPNAGDSNISSEGGQATIQTPSPGQTETPAAAETPVSQQAPVQEEITAPIPVAQTPATPASPVTSVAAEPQQSGTLMYSKGVDGNAFETEYLKDKSDRKGIYEIAVNGDKATYKIASNTEAQLFALEDPRNYLSGVDYTTLPTANSKIVNTSLGELEKQGNRWVITKKAGVKFVDPAAPAEEQVATPVATEVPATQTTGVTINNIDDLVNRGAARLSVSENGNPVAFEMFDVAVDPETKTAEVAFIKKGDRTANSGIGTNAYIELGTQLAERGITLQSMNQAQLPGGRAIWDNLIAQGYAQKIGNGRYEFVNKTAVAPAAQANVTTQTEQNATATEATTNTERTGEAAAQTSTPGDTGRPGKKQKGRPAGPRKAPKLNERYQRAYDLETNDPRQRVMQYFIGGGQVNSSEMRSFFNKSRGEMNARLWMQKKDGPTIDQLAHNLWEEHASQFQDMNGEGDQTTTMDYRDAIEDVMNSYAGKNAIVNDLYDQHPDSIEEAKVKEWAEEQEDLKKEFASSFEDGVDILSQLTPEEVARVIAEHETGETAYVQSVISQYNQPAETTNPEYETRLADADVAVTAAQRNLSQKESAYARLQSRAAENAQELQGAMFGSTQQNMFGSQGVADNGVIENARAAVDQARTELRTAQETLSSVEAANPLQSTMFGQEEAIIEANPEIQARVEAMDREIDALPLSPEAMRNIGNYLANHLDPEGNVDWYSVENAVNQGEADLETMGDDPVRFLNSIVNQFVPFTENNQQPADLQIAERAAQQAKNEQPNQTPAGPATSENEPGSTDQGQPGESISQTTDAQDTGKVNEQESEPGGPGISEESEQVTDEAINPRPAPIPPPVPTGDELTDAVNEYNYRRHILETKEVRAQRTEERGETLSDKEKASMDVAKKKLSDSIRKLKIKNPGMALTTPAQIPVVLWNAAVEVVALAVDGGQLLRAGIQAGVDYINKRTFTPWNEQLFRNQLGDNDIYERTPDEIRQQKREEIQLSVDNKKAADALIEAVRNNQESLSSAQAHINSIKGLSAATKDKINNYIRNYVEIEIYKGEGDQWAERHLSDNAGDFGKAQIALTDEVEMALLAATTAEERENIRNKNAAARAHLNSLQTSQNVQDGTLVPVYSIPAAPEAFGLPDRTIKDKIQEYGQDRLARLQKAQDNSIVEITPQLDAVTAKRLSKSISHYLMQEVWDYIGNKEMKSGTFFDRLSKAKLDVRKLGLYQYAMHAKERNAYNAQRRQDLFDSKLYELEKAKIDATPAKALEYEARINEIKNQQDPNFALMPDGGSGMTNQQADDILAEMEKEGMLDQYKTFADEYRTNVIDKILDYKYDAGIIDETTYNHLKTFYENYVPLKVDMTEEEEKSKDRRMFKSTGLSGRDLYRSKGSVDRKFDQRNNPMLQSIIDLEKTITKSVENKANIKMANLVRANPNDNIWKIQVAQFETTTDKNGNVYRVNEINRPQYAIEFYESGTKKYIVLYDRGLQNLIRTMGDPKIDRIISIPTRIMTAVNTLYNPEFLVKNALFDLGDAYLSTLGNENKELSKRYQKYAAKAPLVLSQMVMGKDTNPWKIWLEDWKSNGGEISFINQTSIDENATKSLKIFDSYGKKFSAEHAKKALNALKVVQGSIEQMTRVMVYRSAVESGIARDKAANIARNATLDFEKKGVFGTYINSFKAFANAGIQGGTNVIWLAKNSKRVQRFLGAMILAGIAEGMINELFGGCDDDKKEGCWWEVPEFQKQRSFIIPTGPGNTPISIPIGRQFAWFNYLGKNVYAVMRGHQNAGEFTKNTLGSLLDFYNPAGGSSPIPQQIAGNLAPVVGLSMNENNFGTPITPLRDDMTAHENHWPKTGKGYVETAEALSKLSGGGEGREGKIEVSPDQLKFMAQSAMGGVFNFFVNSSNAISNKIEGEPVKNKDVPFLRVFSRESDMAITKEKYYNMLEFSKKNVMTEDEVQQFEEYARALYQGGQISEDDMDYKIEAVDKNQSKLENRYDKDE